MTFHFLFLQGRGTLGTWPLLDISPHHLQSAHSDVPTLMGGKTDTAVALGGENHSKDFRYRIPQAKGEHREKGSVLHDL